MTASPSDSWDNCWNCGSVETRGQQCVRCGQDRHADPLLDRRLGNAQIKRLIFAEPESNLYEARGENGEVVALRTLPVSMRGDSRACNVFVKAARRQRRVDTNPSLLQHYSHGVSRQGVAWMLLDWSQGQSLASLWKPNERNLIPMDRAYHLSVQMLSALEALHQVGLVHGRISPHVFHWSAGPGGDWLRLIHGGRGLMRIIRDGMTAPGSLLTGGLVERELWHGPRPSLLYRPPWAVRLQEDNEQSDLYSLGVCLYQLFAGRLPYRMNRPTEVLKLLRAGRKVQLMPAEDRRAELSRYPSLMRVLRKTMDQRVEFRYRSVKECRQDFEAAYSRDKASREQHLLQTSRGKAQEKISHRVVSAPAEAPQEAPQAVRQERKRTPRKRTGVSPVGIQYSELDQLAAALEEASQDLARVVADFDPEASLLVLEEAIADRAVLAAAPDASASAALNGSGPPTSRNPQGSPRSRAQIWSVVCLASKHLRRGPRGTLRGVGQKAYREALLPVEEMAAWFDERHTTSHQGVLTCVVGPGSNLEMVLGRLMLFLLSFDRTHAVEPPAVSVVGASLNLHGVSEELPPSLEPLVARARELAPLGRSGELVAEHAVIDALGMAERAVALPRERGADGQELLVWRFAGGR